MGGIPIASPNESPWEPIRTTVPITTSTADFLCWGLASLTYCQENDKPTNAAEDNADHNTPGLQYSGGLPTCPYSSVKHSHLLADQLVSYSNGATRYVASLLIVLMSRHGGQNLTAVP